MALSPQAQQIQRWRASPATMVRELFKVEPDAWQEEVLEMFPSRPRIAMKAAKGPGKELCKQTLIPTPSGDMRFGDLKVNDFVFAEDGTPTRVTAVFDNGIKPVWRVTFDDGSSVLAGAEHQWKVRGQAERARKCSTQYQRDTHNNEIWTVLTTEQIIARGVRVKNGRWAGRQFEIPLHGPADYPEKDLPIDPYLLGVWLGDGCRSQPTYFKPYPEVEAEIQRRGYGTKRSGSNVRILESVKSFERVECYEEYSFSRFIPQLYREASIEQRQDLLCGLMDTDGCIGDDGHMEYDTTSRQMAQDIVWLVRSLGGNAFVKDGVKKAAYRGDNGELIRCRDCYRVTIRVPFNPFRIKHKAERWVDPLRSNSTVRYMKRYIDSIEPAGEADCMCITVEHPSQCYLANDFIVTHNTTVLAWLCWNFLLTRPHPNIAATSISGANLRDGLWKECAKWRNSSELLKTLFEWQNERIYLKEHPATWWMSARSWPQSANAEQIGQTLAGLHTDYIMFVIDESGGIPTAITMSAEAALSSCVEGHILQAGNTNSLEGALYAACVIQKHLWHVVVITGDPEDPKRSPRISLEWARQMIQTYGRDDPHVKVMVLGEWPSSSINALIGPDEVMAAMKRQYQQHDIDHAARVLGVDVARQGNDASVIFPRQGLVAFPPKIMHNVDGRMGAGQVNRICEDWKPDAVFIDNTGGWGAAWIDQLKNFNRTVIPIGFADTPHDKRFYNRRTEMWFAAAQWIRDGGMLPNVSELVAELSQSTYTFKGDRMILEPKDLLKAKIGRSPDIADAFCLGFADPVHKANSRQTLPRRERESEYDPFAPFYATR